MRDPFRFIACVVMDPDLWGSTGCAMMHKEAPVPADSFPSHVSYMSVKHDQFIAWSSARHCGEQSLLQSAYKSQEEVQQVAENTETFRVRNTFPSLTGILSNTALSVSLWELTAISFMWAD